MRDRIGLDFDGVCSTHSGWKGHQHHGDPIAGIKDFCEELRRLNFEIIVFTSRTCEEHTPSRSKRAEVVASIEAWFKEHEIPFDFVWNGHGKPACCAYIDDRAVHCNPQGDPLAFQKALAAVEILRKRSI